MYTARCARSGHENGVRRNGTSQTANGQNRNATHRLGVSNSAAGAASSLRIDRGGDKPRRRQRFYEFAAQRREYYAVSRGGGENSQFAGVARSLLGETGLGPRIGPKKRAKHAHAKRGFSDRPLTQPRGTEKSVPDRVVGKFGLSAAR